MSSGWRAKFNEPSRAPPPRELHASRADMSLRSASLRLAKGGAEQQAIEAGEIDAIIDHATNNIILLPAARRALRDLAGRAYAGSPKAADEPGPQVRHRLRVRVPVPAHTPPSCSDETLAAPGRFPPPA